MKLHELKPVEGARTKRNRVGRGMSSGNGKTSGRGHNGQKSRSGGSIGLSFEGGQLPLFRSIPKRGFTNVNRKDYSVVNVSDLNRFEDNTEVTPELLIESGIAKNNKTGIKILGNGKLEKKLTIKAHKFSSSAVAAIEQQGGTHEVI